jgi:enoyl-CoA hydratase
MAYDTILVQTRGKVGLITLNRPKALNALNTQVMAEVVAALQAFEADANVGAIVITGSERAFAAGADIKEMQAKNYIDVYMEDFFAGWDALGRVRKPIIAAVAGYALGGGCELAMMCDFIIAGDNARFGPPDALRRQVQGNGHVPDRTADGRRRGRAGGARLAHRPGGRGRR